uniref:Uncharacterized protein n=1 Tax=Pseudomonas monteilii TaxID=76759 RepID=A0A6B7PWA2_9PSED|nr:hypothetical protein [Pseudomonas monteilii]
MLDGEDFLSSMIVTMRFYRPCRIKPLPHGPLRLLGLSVNRT